MVKEESGSDKEDLNETVLTFYNSKRTGILLGRYPYYNHSKWKKMGDNFPYIGLSISFRN